MQKRRCVALLALSGSGLLAGCLIPNNENRTYTPIQLSNPIAVVRDNEPILIPISEVKSRYPNFDPNDFSVNLMASNWNPKEYDPMLATDPPPTIPAQLFDTKRDGQPDALLVVCDIGPHERRILSVCTPRFSKMSKAIGPHEGGGLYMREDTHREGGKLKSDGGYAPVSAAVLDPGHQRGDDLYQCGGPVFETDTNGWRLLFDSRLCLDVIGKKQRGLVMANSVKEPLDLSKVGWGASLFGEPESVGAGALGYSENGTFVPMAGFDTVSYRMVNDGGAAKEVELTISGAKLGHESYEVRWRITHYAGNRYLRHDVNLSRGGHHLAFAITATGPRKEELSGHIGWTRASTWGSSGLAKGVGGSLGIGILASGRQVNGFVKNPQDVIGLEFDGNARNITFYTLAAWDQEPQGLRSVDDLTKAIDDLAQCQNDPISVVNFEKQADQ